MVVIIYFVLVNLRYKFVKLKESQTCLHLVGFLLDVRGELALWETIQSLDTLCRLSAFVTF